MAGTITAEASVSAASYSGHVDRPSGVRAKARRSPPVSATTGFTARGRGRAPYRRGGGACGGEDLLRDGQVGFGDFLRIVHCSGEGLAQAGCPGERLLPLT